ncbi:alpha/beta fold hydrolase [Rossellomorea marisflavi]|uniref:alpha/beta fold hydrolase n=1 Tax=Rossellomorea marisflavi TaxID=189381 RepID=UPI0021CCF5F4|nr:alpha/beta hydrolase [Rossellomorea marisflavi]
MILHTDVTGQGAPLVFLHTGLQTGLTDFEQQADFFKGTHQVIRPDLRGHGSSISDEYENFFEDSAKDLAETIEHLEVGAVHLVGCSLGGDRGAILRKALSPPDQKRHPVRDHA